jgi:hypothetical protein
MTGVVKYQSITQASAVCEPIKGFFDSALRHFFVTMYTNVCGWELKVVDQ